MKKTSILKIINPLLFIIALLQAVTGAIYFLGGNGLNSIIHMIGGAVMAGLAVIHIFLNWGWVKSNYFNKITK